MDNEAWERDQMKAGDSGTDERVRLISELQEGDQAPDYKLRSTEGEPVSAREAAASYRALVLVFLRGLR